MNVIKNTMQTKSAPQEPKTMRSNGKNSEMDMKLQKLREVGQSILNNSEQAEEQEELTPDEKKLLLTNIFQYKVKIYEGNTYKTKEILPKN